MTAKTLFTELTARGIVFDVAGDKLRLHPAAQVTATELENIRRHKPAIIAIVETAKRANPASSGPYSESNSDVNGNQSDDFFGYVEFCWGQIPQKDFEYLTSPRNSPPPCSWCGGRLVHHSACDDLRRSWEPRFPFGKHKGKRISDVPTGYLEWAASWNAITEELKLAIQTHLQERN